MLKNNKTMKVQNLKRSDIIIPTLNNRVEIAKQVFQSYLEAGYSVYDVVAEGGFNNLSGKTAGKWLCVWINGTPTGSYTIYNAAFSTHTKVAIMGIRVDSIYNIVNIDSPFSLVGSSSPVSGLNKFEIVFCNVTFKSQLAGLSKLQYSNFITDNQEIDLNSLSTIESCTLDKISFGSYSLTDPGNEILFNNCKIKSSVSTSYSSSYLRLKNCSIESSITMGEPAAPTRLDIRYDNVRVLSGVTYTIKATCLTSSNILYNNGGTIAGNISGLIINYISNNTAAQINYSLIVTSLLSSANYTTASITPTYTRKSIRGYLGTIKRNYYQLNFNPQNTISDTLKYNDDNDLLVWYRDDIEADLTSASIAKIKNLTYYQTDGVTAVTTFRDSESYLIIAERDSTAGTYGIFGYHKGQLYPTAYSEIWDNELYTIKRVINILEYPEEVTYSNLYNIANSPIEASYLMQDQTSKVIR